MVSLLQKEVVKELNRRDLPTESIITLMTMLEDNLKLASFMDFLIGNPDADEKQMLIEAILLCQDADKLIF